jgi:hypothetical protein
VQFVAGGQGELARPVSFQNRRILRDLASSVVPGSSNPCSDLYERFPLLRLHDIARITISAPPALKDEAPMAPQARAMSNFSRSWGSYLYHHTRLRVGRYIWRGRRPTRTNEGPARW